MYWQNLILFSSTHVEDTLAPWFSFSFWRGTILVTIMNMPTHPALKKASRTWFDSGPEVRNHWPYYPVTWDRVLLQSQSHTYSRNCFLWKPKVHYHIHTSPRPIHLNSAHTFLSWFFNIFLLFTLRSFKRVSSFFLTRIFNALFLMVSTLAVFPTIHTLLDLIISAHLIISVLFICWRLGYKVWRFSLRNFHTPPVTSFYLGTNVLSNTGPSNTRSLYSPFIMMRQVPHPTHRQAILSAKYIMWPFNDMVHELYFSDTVNQ